MGSRVRHLGENVSGRTVEVRATEISGYGDEATPGHVRTGTRLLLFGFALLTFLAASQLLLFGGSTDRYFAWTITVEPMAGFLGAAYAAGFVLSVLSLRQARWERVRVTVVAVTAFTMLALVPTLIHLHKLHLMMGAPAARFAAWFWLIVYLITPPACVAVLIRQEVAKRSPVRHVMPMPLWLAALIGLQGAILAGVGGILFVRSIRVHELTSDAMHFWPWRLTPLTAGIVGAWLIAFGVAAVTAIWQRDLADLVVPATGYAAFGLFELLVLFRYRTDVRPDSPWRWVYLVFLATVLLAGVYGLWAGRHRQQSGSTEQIMPELKSKGQP